ncbi:hypothetical protein DBV15_05125 [Temnothorax longispinosus]|uniref:Uncharacterized protein n=1 Tax=Temnothorax longispinosus TaxID=300112 RepID=A0A4S2KVE1_9HYME|nr:hypothetical protein DBV15_05125 [Temnothorax longispinosus]
MNCRRDTSFIYRTSSRRGAATMRTGKPARGLREGRSFFGDRSCIAEAEAEGDARESSAKSRPPKFIKTSRNTGARGLLRLQESARRLTSSPSAGLENGGHVCCGRKLNTRPRPIVGRVAGTPAERVLPSRPSPASPSSRRRSPATVESRPPECERDEKKMACNRAAKSGFAAEAQRKVRKLGVNVRNGRWHLCHPDLVNNYPPRLPPPVPLALTLTRGLDLLRDAFPRRLRS